MSALSSPAARLASAPSPPCTHKQGMLPHSSPRKSTAPRAAAAATAGLGSGPRAPVLAGPRRQCSVACSSSTPPGTRASGQYLGKFGPASSPVPPPLTPSPALPPPRHPAGVLIPLSLAVFLPVLGGILMSSFASPLQDWYLELRKPSWKPPDWLYTSLWSLLYSLAGLASFLVFAAAAAPPPVLAGALRLYCFQLFVSYVWWIVFFQMKLLLPSVFLSGVNGVLAWGTMTSFRSISPVAGWLLMPYLFWLLYTFVFTWKIWRMNLDDALPGATWSATPRSSNW